MKEIEILEKRGPKEKHFLREDGCMKAIIYNEDIHYLKNGKYEEIDNTIVEEDTFYTNKSNSYKVKFNKKEAKNLMEVEKDEHYLKIKLIDNKIKKISISKNEFKYVDILNTIDVDYKVMNNKLKEGILLKNKDSLNQKILFDVDTNLDLKILKDGSIIAFEKDNTIFKIEAPYMIDKNNNENHNISYKLDKKLNNYLLELILDKRWLETAEYPVTIDPTIVVDDGTNALQDTYIYPGDTNVSRGSLGYLKIGVEKVNNVNVPNRALIKLQLPTLSTGDQVVSAQLNLTGYETSASSSNFKHVIFAMHPITQSWTEAGANWNNMNDKYESRIEGVSDCDLMPLLDSDNSQFNLLSSDITNIVKHWYTDKPNYGLMIKQNIEEYKNSVVPTFSSKDSNNKPYLIIVYRNQNGLENYMDYFKQSFNIGSTYVNNYNGNLVGIFDVGKTIGGKFPVSINLVYNTNDVVDNKNIGYGLGWRFNLSQTIEEVTVDGTAYLKYIDEDATAHYFYLDNNIYKDEDGLDLTITNNSNYYLLKDKDGNTMKFVKTNNVGYLSEIKNVKNDAVTITYDSNKIITRVTDANGAQINLTYGTNNITIINPDGNRTLNYSNNKLTSIVSYLGTISFEYNTNNVITKIVDIDQTKIGFEYYSILPYRIKKVSEYGIDNSLGKYYNLIYQFNSTTITDNNGQTTTKTFKNNGTLESISSLKAREDVGDAYGKSVRYGEAYGTMFTKYSNKLMEEYIPLQSVKNYITNSNFEASTIDFSAPSGVTLSLSQDQAFIGQKSLKIVSNGSNKIITRNISITKGKNYTFSAYIKTTNKAKVALSYTDSNNATVRLFGSEVDENTDFYRSDVTINYPTTAASNLKLEIITDSGTTYVDAIQLEEGEVANNYNLVENSDFSNGLSDWNISADYHDVIYNFDDPNDYPSINLNNLFQVVTLDSGKKTLKINMNPDIITRFSKTFNISGSAGDVYTLSLWYKNKGIVSDYGMGAFFYNVIDMSFDFVESSNPQGAPLQSKSFVPNETEWQYFSVDFVAIEDYNSFTLFLDQELNANEFYITDISLFKNNGSITYEYDDNGNILWSQGLNNDIKQFKYDNNNQLIKITNPIGKDFNFEYDNTITNRIKRAITNSGLSNIIDYDTFGNPKYTKIAKENIETIINGLYKIRLKGTESYLRLINNQLSINVDECGHDKWYFEKSGSYYKIRHSIINNKYFTVSDSNLILNAYNSDNSLFSLIKNNNGSYKIQSKLTGKYLKISNNNIIFANLEENNSNFEFYIEIPNKLFIQNDAEYDVSGKYITNITDTLLNKRIYSTNISTGLLNSITNAKNAKTEYIYNSKKQLLKAKTKDKKIDYSYNEQNRISKISNGNVDYNFIYDKFGNIEIVKINNNISLINNNYETNNGNLVSTTYGNGNNIRYEYDEFDRIKKITKSDNVYNYKYDSNGNIVKIIGNNDFKKYVYDIGKKLYKYLNDDFYIEYKYNTNNDIIKKKYKFDNLINIIENVYNDDASIIQSKFDSQIFNYGYDELGRLINANINNTFIINYNYLKNGNRSSLIVDSIQSGTDKYNYKYDSLGNIIQIYHNDILENDYYYDLDNQLIKEEDYYLNLTTRYRYDNYGNIISKKIYKLNSYNQIEQKIYKYNNLQWKDQLTSFNDEIILYDNIGNPISIGSTSLTWINGRQLYTYTDTLNSITYRYDERGIRIKKNVNNIETVYKLEGKKIIYEKTGNDIIYYMYDVFENLLGLKYNNQQYYYLKNVQGDIYGILNSNYEVIAKYKYDSFGNNILITDGSDNIITNSNHIAFINPYRYRGYYYDKETNLYYVNSRYYNPAWGRFLNADGSITANKDIISNNLYSYVSNNFINNIDTSGKSWFSNTPLGILASQIGKAIGDFAKQTISSVSTLYLLATDKPISSYMFNKSIYEPEKEMPAINKFILRQEIKESPVIEKNIIKCIQKSNGSSFINCKPETSSDAEFNSGDLLYSVQHANIEMSGIKGDKAWEIDVKVYDKYDFDHWRWGLSKADLANNLGYVMERTNLLKKYDWEVEFKYIVPYELI